MKWGKVYFEKKEHCKCADRWEALNDLLLSPETCNPAPSSHNPGQSNGGAGAICPAADSPENPRISATAARRGTQPDNTQLWNQNFHSQSQKTRWQIHIFQHVYLHFPLSQNPSHTLMSYSHPPSSWAINTWSPFKLEIPKSLFWKHGRILRTSVHICNVVPHHCSAGEIHPLLYTEGDTRWINEDIWTQNHQLTPAAPNWVWKVPGILLPASHLGFILASCRWWTIQNYLPAGGATGAFSVVDVPATTAPIKTSWTKAGDVSFAELCV